MIDFRIGFGYDSHRLEVDIPLVIGGVTIPHDKGCVAHSDGDALIHALCDALLGAAGLEDIGTHFPDNDPTFHKIDSKLLLVQVVKLIHQKKYRVHQVDATLLIEKPKLQPFVHHIRQTLAEILEIDKNAIAVKVKTNEKMGFVGREEGVVAYVIATIVK